MEQLRLRRSLEIVLIATLFAASAAGQFGARSPYQGRWDLTITAGSDTSPAWMEVLSHDGVVTVVISGREGIPHGAENIGIEAIPVSAAPGLNATSVSLGQQTVASRLGFTTLESYAGKMVPVRWSIDGGMGGKLTGTQKRADGVEAKISGESAPALKSRVPSRWTAPHALDSAANAADFKLHVEVNCPAESDGGILLRGRYKVDVGYKTNSNKMLQMGAIAGFIAPSSDLPAMPGTWESFDITLVGRMVSITRNGTPIVSNKEIPGITAGALDSSERQPGPVLLIPGESSPVQFRNATISEPAH